MRYSILFVSVLAMLAGCAKNGATPGPGFSGKLTLTDEFGKPQTDHSGVLIIITDTSPQITTLSAADGTYSLNNVPTGSHSLSYTKTGYGTFVLEPLETEPGKVYAIRDAVSLSQVSTTRTTLAATAIKVKDLYLISGSVSPAPTTAQPRPHRLFLQTYDKNTTALPIATHYQLSVRGYTRPDGTFTDTVTTTQLSLFGITGGYNSKTLVSVRVWAAGDNPSASTYYYYLSTKTIYPAANLALNPNTMLFYANY